MGGQVYQQSVLGDNFSRYDPAAKVELFLFQGQKGDPGLSPGKAYDGAKVGFQGPQAQGRVGVVTRETGHSGGAILAKACA